MAAGRQTTRSSGGRAAWREPQDLTRSPLVRSCPADLRRARKNGSAT